MIGVDLSACHLVDGSMDPKKTLTGIRTLLDRLSSEIRSLDTVPRTSEDVTALLLELAEAANDKEAHFQRFPREDDPNVYENSPECRADWGRVLQRYDEVVTRIATYAQMLVLAKSATFTASDSNFSTDPGDVWTLADINTSLDPWDSEELAQVKALDRGKCIFLKNRNITVLRLS